MLNDQQNWAMIFPDRVSSIEGIMQPCVRQQCFAARNERYHECQEGSIHNMCLKILS